MSAKLTRKQAREKVIEAVFTGVMATIAHRAPSGGWVMPDDFKVETVRVLAWQPLPVL